MEELGLKLHLCSNEETSYFGYYTLSPENNEGQILFNVLNLSNNKLDIHVMDKIYDNIIGNPTAFNMQQGCMLQWGIQQSESDLLESV